MSKVIPIGKDGQVIKDFRYIPNTHDIGDLEGRLLTLLEATTADPQQRKALKDVFRQTLWTWATQLPTVTDEPDRFGIK